MKFLDSIIAVRMNELKSSPIYSEKTVVKKESSHRLEKNQSKKVAMPSN